MRHLLAFRCALPLLSIAVCVFCLWPERAYVLFLFRSGFATPQTPPKPIIFYVDDPADPIASEQVRDRNFAWLRPILDTLPAAFNLPGGVIQLPTVMITADSIIWKPPGAEMHVWRSLSWTFFGLVFWWIAGRAADALRTSTVRLRWWDLLAAAFSFGSGCLWAILAILGPIFGDADVAFLLEAGGGAWIILGGLTLVAYVLQLRTDRCARATK